jgi:hypothetical protein
MNPSQLIQSVVAALIIAAILGLAKMVMGKADKSDVTKNYNEHKADDLKEHNDMRELVSKMDVKLDAALLIVGAAITRPELAEKILAMTGRSDDRMARVTADIVQLFTKVEANAKSGVETEKKLDDLPSRVRTLEENQKRS